MTPNTTPQDAAYMNYRLTFHDTVGTLEFVHTVDCFVKLRPEGANLHGVYAGLLEKMKRVVQMDYVIEATLTPMTRREAQARSDTPIDDLPFTLP